ncbi:hypothetical protein [Scytonema sp. NUACC21]
MFNSKESKVKVILSILAMTSIAALTPSAYAQTAKPGKSVDNILNRANINTNSTELQRHRDLSSPSIEKLPEGLKPGGINGILDGGCNNGKCGGKPNIGREVLTNPGINPASGLNQSLPQIHR